MKEQFGGFRQFNIRTNERRFAIMKRGKMLKQKEYKLSDEVIARIAQCLQEAILLSVDVTDTLRMMRMCEDEDSSGNLFLTTEYKKNIQSNHDRLLANAQKMKIESLTEDVV